MKKMKKMSAKCNIRINKYNKLSSTIPKTSESFLWKKVNWKKIELRLNIFQNKIYAAKKNQNIKKVWHKIDGRRQFAFKDRNEKYVTLSLYRKVAKGVSLVKYVKIKNDVSIYNGDLNY